MAKCPQCGNELSYVEQYKQWYCYTCQKYQQPAPETGAAPPPPPAGGAQNLDYEVKHSPSFSVLIFKLQMGQKITAESGAMMYMHPSIQIDTHGRKGGLLKGIMTSALGGESFFVNTFTATTGPGELGLVGPTMGDIKEIDLSRSGGMILQSGAYLASEPHVNLDTKWQGLKGFLSERDIVMLHASGAGRVWVTSFGGIIEKDLQPGETISVDTGHLVAFADNMPFNIRRVGGWKATLLSGEGLVADITGPGKILMQTRTIPSFAAVLARYIPSS